MVASSLPQFSLQMLIRATSSRSRVVFSELLLSCCEFENISSYLFLVRHQCCPCDQLDLLWLHLHWEVGTQLTSNSYIAKCNLKGFKSYWRPQIIYPKGTLACPPLRTTWLATRGATSLPRWRNLNWSPSWKQSPCLALKKFPSFPPGAQAGEQEVLDGARHGGRQRALPAVHDACQSHGGGWRALQAAVVIIIMIIMAIIVIITTIDGILITTIISSGNSPTRTKRTA